MSTIIRSGSDSESKRDFSMGCIIILTNARKNQ